MKKGERKDVFHYIPVIASLRNLLEDKSTIGMLENARNKVDSKPGLLKDLTDGIAYLNNSFFRNNPSAMAGHFYSDCVELTNPLGAAKGKHKINQVFYTVAQVSREQRSQIDRVQLCMVFKEKLIKKYGFASIFRRLIEDLKILEGGVSLTEPVPRVMKFGILAYSADNLEAHSLGGFSCCFSSKDVCRFCHITYDELDSHIHDFDGSDAHKYWSVKEYDNICKDLTEEEQDSEEVFCRITEDNLFDDSCYQEDTTDDFSSEDEMEQDVMTEGRTMNNFGLRHKCPLNALQSFHAVTQFPPDCMHDLMEGKLNGSELVPHLI